MITYFIISFFCGTLISAIFIYVYMYFFRRKPLQLEIKNIFTFDPYTSQQVSKLLGEKILSNLVITNKLISINENKLPLKFQSQWCEDIVLYSIFKDKHKGFYIEIGAFDGIRLSNTYFFECIGWTGLLVEPQPMQFKKLTLNRPNSICHEVCISISKEDTFLNIIENEDYETWSFLDSTDDKHLSDKGFKTRKIQVKSKTIDELIPKDIASIDFLSIDVEGMELEVLKTFDLKKYKPEIILLENPDNEINEYLLQFGYKPFLKTWINYFYTYDTNKYSKIDIYNDLGIEIKG